MPRENNYWPILNPSMLASKDGVMFILNHPSDIHLT